MRVARMFGMGPTEMIAVAVIALLVFGKDLPNVARDWGKTFNEFRRHLNGVKSELNDAIYAEPERPKLQYHPQFQERDPLPAAIPADGGGDLAATAAETPAADDELVEQIPSD